MTQDRFPAALLRQRTQPVIGCVVAFRPHGAFARHARGGGVDDLGVGNHAALSAEIGAGMVHLALALALQGGGGAADLPARTASCTLFRHGLSSLAGGSFRSEGRRCSAALLIVETASARGRTQPPYRYHPAAR